MDKKKTRTVVFFAIVICIIALSWWFITSDQERYERAKENLKKLWPFKKK